MSATATPLAPAGTPQPAGGGPRMIHWTVDLFHRVNATGAFAGRRPILIDGVLLEQGPMNPPHAIAMELLVDVMRAAFGGGWRLRPQLPLVLGLDIDPLPDLAVVSGTARGTTEHPTTASLVVEVSDTTLALDTTKKAESYATAGVPDYWVIDLVNRRLLVFRDPVPLPALGVVAYETHLTLGPTDRVSPLAALSASILVSDLLP